MARHPQQLVSSSTLMVLLKRVIKRACSIRWTTSRHGTFLASWDFRYLFHHLCYVFLLVFYCCCYGCGRARVLVIRPAALLLSKFQRPHIFLEWNAALPDDVRRDHFRALHPDAGSVHRGGRPRAQRHRLHHHIRVGHRNSAPVHRRRPPAHHTGRHVLLPGADVRHPQFARMAVPGSAGPRQHDLRG